MLVATVDEGSLSAAARKLRVPVPTLSRKVAELEEVLGTRLLIRTTRKITLTDAGISYVATARRIIELADDAQREAAGEFITPRGDLIITAPFMFGRKYLLPIVTEFLGLFPEINMSLVMGDRYVNLMDDHIDMALRMGQLPDSTMIATRVGALRRLTCASPQLIAGHGMPRHPSDLATLPCIGTGQPGQSTSWEFREPETGKLFDIRMKARLVTSTEGAVDAAASGTGFVRLLHYQALEALADGRLQMVLEDFEPEPMPVNLVHVARGQMPLKMRRFLDFSTPILRQALTRISQGPQPVRGTS
ncbi:MAG: LysR family transcriptional regulator [Sphingomonadales bacterium]|nr:LysR family transcriptional regulator [Sphingomonadales bacterium]MDE2171114.1 LysR family transcriptional regulator [Sphingomonadales bacterium]